MSVLREMAQNKTLVAPLLAWALAQILKIPFSFDRQNGFDFTRLVSVGGMPSAHSALVTSLATITGLHSGWRSPLFGVAFVVAVTVMYDAAGIRQAAGDQAKVLNQMMREWKASKSFRNVALRELLGHTPVEVFVGALIGVLIAVAVSSF